jgi:N-acetylneuraminic acid mutarotase
MRQNNKTIGSLIITLFIISMFVWSTLPTKASEQTTTENNWTETAPLPKTSVAFDGLGAAVVNGEIYFFGGWGIAQRYDPKTNVWAEIAPLPEDNVWANVIAFQDKIYVIGGIADMPTQVYDPATNTWENKTGIPETLIGQKAEVVNGKIYVISGGKPAPLGIVSTSDKTYVYDPSTDLWSTMKQIPTPVQSYASAVIDNKIYIIGGETTPNYQNDLKSSKLVQIFDPTTNQWTTGTPLPIGVNGEGACSTSGVNASKKLYVMGGLLYYYGLGTSADLNPQTTFITQIYDPETGNWSTDASFPDARWHFSVVNINDVLYVVGGSHAEEVQGKNWTSRSNGVAITYKFTPLGYRNDSFPTPSNTMKGLDYPLSYMLMGVIIIIVLITVLSLLFFRRHIKISLN